MNKPSKSDRAGSPSVTDAQDAARQWALLLQQGKQPDLAAFLENALVYASPYRRTRETLAGILDGAGVGKDALRIYEDPRLREVEHGYEEVAAQEELRKVHGDEATLEPWVIHDLRRTARSLMSRAKVNVDVAERCLAHVIGGVRGTYDRHSFYDEKRDAFERLAALVERIVNPPTAKVVALRAGNLARDRPSSTILRAGLERSPLSGVDTIGHPLARRFVNSC